jgi:biotin-(acetyl-CoA carboxylase) ligase
MILRVLESLSEDRKAQMDAYRSLCPIEGREVLVMRGEERFFARALHVEDDGALLLEREGKTMRLSSGEISIRETDNT